MKEFSNSLKTWRKSRRFSQLDLALEAEISARHLSFLETGRAKPSREMVIRLGEALQLPLDARNQLLTHAGFAVRYRARDWAEDDMAPIRRAISRQLDQHLPFPGLAIDRLWTIREANRSARALFAPFGIGPGDSLLDLLMMDQIPQVIENWPEVAHHAALRLRTEAAAHGGVPEFDDVIRYLSSVTPNLSGPTGPVIPTILRFGDQRLSMFATLAQFGTPEDLMLNDLKVELYFPMDAATEIAFQQMANVRGSSG